MSRTNLRLSSICSVLFVILISEQIITIARSVTINPVNRSDVMTAAKEVTKRPINKLGSKPTVKPLLVRSTPKTTSSLKPRREVVINLRKTTPVIKRDGVSTPKKPKVFSDQQNLKRLSGKKGSKTTEKSALRIMDSIGEKTQKEPPILSDLPFVATGQSVTSDEKIVAFEQKPAVIRNFQIESRSETVSIVSSETESIVMSETRSDPQTQTESAVEEKKSNKVMIILIALVCCAVFVALICISVGFVFWKKSDKTTKKSLRKSKEELTTEKLEKLKT